MSKRCMHASANSFKSTFEILTLIYFNLGLKVSFNSTDNKYLQNCISLKVIDTVFLYNLAIVFLPKKITFRSLIEKYKKIWHIYSND